MNLLAAIAHPLGVCVLLAVGLTLGLYLFVTLKWELRALDRRQRESQKKVLALEAVLMEARAAAAGLESDVREMASQTGMLVAPQPAPSGLNLSKRTQVLRMHRAGQDSAGIAAALALPRAEVDLLLKVHRLVVEQI
ncbi:MAG TPA: hypothetical protein VME43_06520 [Bryobacteraceae bacterium]|nr:hypothetical protein [Bryobacteraceae bacterium]